MIARLLSVLCLVGFLAACSGTPTSTLGELPRTPQASVEQLLQKAEQSPPALAAQLRLAAADKAFTLNNPARAGQILQQVSLDQLSPAEQVLASTLQAELALLRNRPQSALQTLEHPSLQRLGELPAEQQVRTRLVRAQALEADNQLLPAVRERVSIAPQLTGAAAQDNHEIIWALIARLPTDEATSPADGELGAWLALGVSVRDAITLELQQAAIDNWRNANPDHPAALRLPEPLSKLRALPSQPLSKIALLLPQEGQLASVARALRDGFMSAHYQAQQAGFNPPEIVLYDSTQIESLEAFYRQAQADGAQLVVGPLEKPLVKQLGDLPQLPILTLALNYDDAGEGSPAQLFQFGLAAEDEARSAARRAWNDGMRRAVALVPRGEWGDRVLAAFNQSWQAEGGTLLDAKHIDQPVQLAGQIADLFQLRQSEARAQRLKQTLGVELAAEPARRADVDFIFLAATPLQAQQIKPTLTFQYAGDVPVYATSHLYSGDSNPAQYRDLSGIRFCETPWLLDENNPLREQVIQQWPQAGGSLGRLYAMGIDAYLLAPRLAQLKALPETRIDGYSGRLSLNSQQRIERELPWAEFQGGTIRRLPDYNL
jgi:outer membrane PBP1 activator LpoA protein